MNTELSRAKDSLDASLNILQEAYITYPIHIGYLMYLESLNAFGVSLAKIATPVYTLYDKLRNVQPQVPPKE